MRRMLLAWFVIAASLLLASSPADACGDKTLRVGRGARYRRAAHPAVILIYIPASLPAASAQKAVRLQSFLKNAGHKVSVVQGADRLGEALNSKPCDLVLSTLAEAAGLQTLLDAAPSKPAVLPVIHKETKPEVATAQRLYKYVVKDASSGEDYLDRIDEVLRSRQHSSSHKA